MCRGDSMSVKKGRKKEKKIVQMGIAHIQASFRVRKDDRKNNGSLTPALSHGERERSASTYFALPDLRAPLTLHIFTHLREDSIQLFWFLTPAEKTAFILLEEAREIAEKWKPYRSVASWYLDLRTSMVDVRLGCYTCSKY